MLDFCLVLFFLLLVVAFRNAVSQQFVERAVLIHENDVVPVFAYRDYREVFIEEVFPIAEGF